jgi:hypothetical protein
MQGGHARAKLLGDHGPYPGGRGSFGAPGRR